MLTFYSSTSLEKVSSLPSIYHKTLKHFYNRYGKLKDESKNDYKFYNMLY